MTESAASSSLILVQTRRVSSSGAPALTTIRGSEPRLVTRVLGPGLRHRSTVVNEKSPIPCGNPEAIAGHHLLRWQIVIFGSRLKQSHYAERCEPASNGDQTSFCRTLLVMLRRKRLAARPVLGRQSMAAMELLSVRRPLDGYFHISDARRSMIAAPARVVSRTLRWPCSRDQADARPDTRSGRVRFAVAG